MKDHIAFYRKQIREVIQSGNARAVEYLLGVWCDRFGMSVWSRSNYHGSGKHISLFMIAKNQKNKYPEVFKVCEAVAQQYYRRDVERYVAKSRPDALVNIFRFKSLFSYLDETEGPESRVDKLLDLMKKNGYVPRVDYKAPTKKPAWWVSVEEPLAQPREISFSQKCATESFLLEMYENECRRALVLASQKRDVYLMQGVRYDFFELFRKTKELDFWKKGYRINDPTLIATAKKLSSDAKARSNAGKPAFGNWVLAMILLESTFLYASDVAKGLIQSPPILRSRRRRAPVSGKDFTK